ncbi:MAG: hypothetical protein EZS28_044485 [Streblomastix strix]|uniref:Gamma tubulin complex component C-terminal domain-containing protein n=1 Tax=Streblomastix strix TaxID=222440 RepID=A0A5J4TNV9_9EUKA|nr:MAG: hypothetical protein EZS28_044485 [Streblomastix strix]
MRVNRIARCIEDISPIPSSLIDHLQKLNISFPNESPLSLFFTSRALTMHESIYELHSSLIKTQEETIHAWKIALLWGRVVMKERRIKKKDILANQINIRSEKYRIDSDDANDDSLIFLRNVQSLIREMRLFITRVTEYVQEEIVAELFEKLKQETDSVAIELNLDDAIILHENVLDEMCQACFLCDRRYYQSQLLVIYCE